MQYNAYMNSLQYTIRSIPPQVDEALRKRAQTTGKSLNETTLEALAKGVGVVPAATFNDLNWFIGQKTLDASFDNAVAWLDDAPRDL